MVIPSAWVLCRATVTDHLNAIRSNKELTLRFDDGTLLPNPLRNSFWSYTFESTGTPPRILAKPIATAMRQILGYWRSSNYNLRKGFEVRKVPVKALVLIKMWIIHEKQRIHNCGTYRVVFYKQWQDASRNVDYNWDFARICSNRISIRRTPRHRCSII